MKTKKYDDSLTLEPGTNRQDKALAASIARVGVSEVARRAKLSQSTISRWSSGTIALSRTTVDRIIRATKE